MDVQLVPKTTLPSGSQTVQPPASVAGSGSEASAKPLLANAAASVPVAPETSDPSAERRQDKLGKQQDETVTAQQAIESLRLTNRRAQLDFNTELSTVFLQIVDTRTEEVVETIPSEELVRQLKNKAEPAASRALEDRSGGVVIDQSI